jgi:hypothetical protein
MFFKNRHLEALDGHPAVSGSAEFERALEVLTESLRTTKTYIKPVSAVS